MNGDLTNSTSELLVVHGSMLSGEACDNSLNALPPGLPHTERWDYDGLFVPNDRAADQALSSKSGPVAVKYRDYRSPVIEMLSPGRYSCPLNEGIYVPGELNWLIPNLSYSEIKAAFPDAPNHEVFIRLDPYRQEIID